MNSRLRNLIVSLAERNVAEAAEEIDIASPGPIDERTLAWIDETFGGAWSSEAYAGINLIVRRGGAPAAFATVDAKNLTYSWLRGAAREPGVGLFGPFGVAPAYRKTQLGRALLNRALDALRERGYDRALIPAVGDERLVRYYRDAAGARVVEEFDRAALVRPKRRTVVMASGNGSNFQAVIDAVASGTLPLDVVSLVVNDERAYCAQRAVNAGVPVLAAVWDRAGETRARYDRRLLEVVRGANPDLVLLLGWMHLLSDEFVAGFPEIVNLHPAFLPLDPQRDDVAFPDGSTSAVFRGAHAIRDALASASAWAGATLHRVTNATDRGPVLARKPLRVQPGEAEQDLMERVHAVERTVVRDGVTRWLFER